MNNNEVSPVPLVFAGKVRNNRLTRLGDQATFLSTRYSEECHMSTSLVGQGVTTFLTGYN